MSRHMLMLVEARGTSANAHSKLETGKGGCLNGVLGLQQIGTQRRLPLPWDSQQTRDHAAATTGDSAHKSDHLLSRWW